MRALRILWLLVFLALAACGGGSDSSTPPPPPPPATFTIGGMVTGLAGTGLDVELLRDNEIDGTGEMLTVAADGTFTFTRTVTNADTWRVKVFLQPNSPAQWCVARPDDAALHARAAGDEVVPLDLYPAEQWLNAWRAWHQAGRREEARIALARGGQWLRRTQAEQVPESFRDSFVRANPVNQQLLRDCAQQGLDAAA